MHYLRLKKARRIALKALKQDLAWWPESPAANYTRSREAYLGMRRKTRVFCSGPCCGNPRRHFGKKTIQEQKADIDAAQQLKELES